jgi:hypothetical protein
VRIVVNAEGSSGMAGPRHPVGSREDRRTEPGMILWIAVAVLVAAILGALVYKRMTGSRPDVARQRSEPEVERRDPDSPADGPG